jgi:predicted ArsR family transcriptional regulator
LDDRKDCAPDDAAPVSLLAPSQIAEQLGTTPQAICRRLRALAAPGGGEVRQGDALVAFRVGRGRRGRRDWAVTTAGLALLAATKRYGGDDGAR